MASVTLEFALPSIPDIASLRVYECPTQDGIFTLIDETTAVGTYPDYINSFTTDQATSETDWFAISYVDSLDAESDLSQPWKGGTQSVVSQVVSRVIQRGATQEESIIIQETEAAVEEYFHQDPYTVPLPVLYRELAGLTYVVLARLLLFESTISTSASQSWTAGLVSMKTADATETQKSIENLLKMAAMELNVNQSRIAQIVDVPIAGGLGGEAQVDITRLQLTEVV